MKVFAVYDAKALMYGTPMFITSVGAAVRSFTDVANDEQSIICKHPTDFVLYEIGSYDERTGKLIPMEPFGNLGNAAEFKTQQPKVAMDVRAIQEAVNGKEN